MKFIFHPDENISIDIFGGKAKNLADLSGPGLLIPSWFVLGNNAFYSSMSEMDCELLKTTGDINTILDVMKRVVLTKEVRSELSQSLDMLCPHNDRVAVRSSACDEDGSYHSFAGQLDSYLYVSPEQVPDRIIKVWRSCYSENNLAYRKTKNLPLVPRVPAVLIQKMVDPDISGVAFGADPVSGQPGITVISALPGPGTGVVSGHFDTDTYRINADGTIINRIIACKSKKHQFDVETGNIEVVNVPEAETLQPALTDDQIRKITELVKITENRFNAPQDIEWAIENDKLYLLQSRPITALTNCIDPEGIKTIWDNSNICESYSGITLPLTFSFARMVYEEVYREFCRLMGFPVTTISKHRNTYRHMLGLINGRVYYNLLSWYRLLADFPGFRANRHFMEQMMGVKEGLPESVVISMESTTWIDRLKDALRLANTCTGLVINFFYLPVRTARFNNRIDSALQPPSPPLSDMRPDELISYFHKLENKLLTRWDAPLVNDFFAMIFFGVLRNMASKWCGDNTGKLTNDLLYATRGIISAEADDLIHKMAVSTRKIEGLVELLCNGKQSDLLKMMDSYPEFYTLYNTYMSKFGDRCFEELKLESHTIKNEPVTLLRSIGNLAASGINTKISSRNNKNVQCDAEKTVRHILANNFIKRAIFNWFLNQTRKRLRDRENLRLKRTYLFARVREIFLEIGHRFSALGILNNTRDIFYLEIDEVFGYVEGTITCPRLDGLAELRKTEYLNYKNDEAPDNRFVTYGMINSGNTYKNNSKIEYNNNNSRQGIGCSSGVVRAQVRIITDPRNADIQQGNILVAEHTDPGWVMIFPLCSGLLIERGSLLSHSAILARELGIPAVVSISGARQWLKDGDWIELDGSNGRVRRITDQGEMSFHVH